jgi:hypothetical protein
MNRTYRYRTSAVRPLTRGPVTWNVERFETDRWGQAAEGARWEIAASFKLKREAVQAAHDLKYAQSRR